MKLKTIALIAAIVCAVASISDIYTYRYILLDIPESFTARYIVTRTVYILFNPALSLFFFILYKNNKSNILKLKTISLIAAIVCAVASISDIYIYINDINILLDIPESFTAWNIVTKTVYILFYPALSLFFFILYKNNKSNILKLKTITLIAAIVCAVASISDIYIYINDINMLLDIPVSFTAWTFVCSTAKGLNSLVLSLFFFILYKNQK